MLERMILQYLKNDLEIPVFMEEQKEKHKRYVLLEKTGSSLEDHICSATIVIQSYAESMYEAAALNEEVKRRMLYGFIMIPEVSKVKLNTDYNFTDTTRKQYRYQAVYDITYQEGIRYGQ